jgi:salicylate hydroxylase
MVSAVNNKLPEIVLILLGMKSTCRRLIYEYLGLLDKATPTGDAAFRACIPLDKITDPELRAFVTERVATRWMGEGRHVQAYPIRQGKLYNMVNTQALSTSDEER